MHKATRSDGTPFFFALFYNLLLFQFVWSVIGTGLVTTALRYRLGAGHHKGATLFIILVISKVVTNIAGRFGLDSVFTLGVIGTAIEDTETSPAFLHLTIPTHGALDPGRRVEVGIVFDVLTLGVVRAGDKASKSAVAFEEFAVFAFGAGLTRFFGTLQFDPINGAGSGTLGEIGA